MCLSDEHQHDTRSPDSIDIDRCEPYCVVTATVAGINWIHYTAPRSMPARHLTCAYICVHSASRPIRDSANWRTTSLMRSPPPIIHAEAMALTFALTFRCALTLLRCSCGMLGSVY